jgi:hypothetical protein
VSCRVCCARGVGGGMPHVASVYCLFLQPWKAPCVVNMDAHIASVHTHRPAHSIPCGRGPSDASLLAIPCVRARGLEGLLQERALFLEICCIRPDLVHALMTL